jgi:hypothetical protein
MVFVVVGSTDADGVVACVIVVAMGVFVSTARVLWHPCTIDSGKHDFLSASKAKFCGHDFVTVPLTEHSM